MGRSGECGGGVAPVLIAAAIVVIWKRSGAIVDGGIDPLPALLDGIALLNRRGVAAQRDIAPCIVALKTRKIDASVQCLTRALAKLARRDVGVAVMGCTAIPIAARTLRDAPFALVDSTQELARATVARAIERGWGRSV
ncbi:hypothetical protein [Burkholderia diffusa]|uniref:hypothetical protein n=1 Tax=Burkholderia diffusa TaxID=488732 RepID=UPI0007597590|nr:hypothetical protein [Burkholderia diffusa]KUZ11320.1 hypothetical protein WI28_15460 [Burkholderia diffusa]KVC43243.1 hypothetical protein WI71_22525 [Burkholderia diffusa]